MYSNSEYNNNLNGYTQDIIDLFYPIGRGFIDFTSTDFSNYLGCSWERELVGLTPIGYDPDDSDFNQLGKTLGEKEHALTEDEIANHIHFGLNYSSSNIPISFKRRSGATQTGYGLDYTPNTGIYQGSNFRTGSAGESQPHNNIQPSKVVAYWKRVA